MQPRGQQRYNYGYNESYGRQEQAPQESFGRQQQAPQESFGRQQQASYGRQEQGHMQPTWQQEPNRTSNPLSDMDLELEMMKRKRQMLQEQRQLLEEQQQLERLQVQRNSPWANNSNSRQFENQQPRQSFNEFPTFTKMYDTGANQRGYKRAGNAQAWRDAAPQPKRYAGNQATFHKAPVPNKGPAGFSAPAGPRVNVARPNKPKFVPNAGAAYKLTERQVEEDIGPVAPPRSAHPQTIYRGPETCSRSVKGRLELVLGRVIREMRDNFFVPPHNIKMANWQFKVLKDRVRTRIQSMMMGKPIGLPDETHGLYRKAHTAKGDLRLLHSILAMTEAPAAKPADAKPAKAPQAPQAPAKASVDKEKVAVESFFRVNLHGKLEAKLDEIFVKLEKVFEAEAAAQDETIQAGTKQAGDVEMTDAPNKEPQDSEQSQEAPESAETPADGEKPAEVKKDESADGEKPAEAKKDESADEEKPAEAKKDESADVEKPAAEVKKDGSGDVEMADATKKPDEKKPEDMSQLEFFEHVLDKALKKKLPQILPRYKNYLISIIARDKQFADLGIKAVEDPTPSQRTPLYFVKIFGKPGLPPRAVMQEYLKKFECESVKRHKSIFNLLFVGVGSEENYNKLLASDGHTLSGKRLEIRSSMKDPFNPMGSVKKAESEDTGTTAKTNGVSDATKQTAETTAEEIKKTGLDSAIDDLDGEIEDLLTCINNSDQAENGDQVEETEEQAEAEEELDETTEEQAETAEEQDETAEEQDETAGEQAETTEEQAETAEEQDTAEKTAPAAKVEEKKDSPDTKASAVGTRRSSRLPQKN